MSVQPIRQPDDHRPKDRRHTASSKKRRQEAIDAEAVGIRIDGVDYVINPNDLTGRIEMEIRKEIGMGLAELQQKLEASPGMDYLGMFMWAVRHANGDDVGLYEVLDSVSAGSSVEVLSEDEKAAVPKA